MQYPDNKLLLIIVSNMETTTIRKKLKWNEVKYTIKL